MDKYIEDNWPNEDRRNEAMADLSRAINEIQPGRGIPTDRELEMLQHASYGLTAPMIAEVVGIGEETVATHITNARAKLGAKNTTHACCLALRQGLIE